LLALTVLVLLLVAARLALPHVVKRYVNQKLAEIPNYRARIADVDIHLWRGAYSIQGIDVVKTNGKVPVPFFSTPNADLSVQWKELFHGALVGEIELQSPKLNFVAGPTEATSQTSIDARWQDRVRELFPLRINRFEVFDGEIHYRDLHSEPKVDLEIGRVHMVARNLTNSREISRTLAATIDVEGRPLETASLKGHVELDPYRERPTFDASVKLENAELTKFNDYLKAYGNFDVQQGRLDVYAEVAAADGKFRGYVKPLVEDLDIVDWDEETDSWLQKAWEGVVATVAGLFQNHPRDRWGTVVSFAGDFDNPTYSLWGVVSEILRNTFIRALPKGLEGDISVAEDTGPGAAPGRGGVTIVEDGKEKESTGDGPGRKRQTSTGEAIGEPAEDGAESEASADGDEKRSAQGMLGADDSPR
jgi:hypothetical protein